MTDPITDPRAHAREAREKAYLAAQAPHIFKFLGVLTAAHLAVTLYFADPYFELARAGAVGMLPFLCLVAGSLTLYVAMFNATVRGRPGKAAFFVAALLLAPFFWAWHVPYLMYAVGYGALLAVGGLRVAFMKDGR